MNPTREEALFSAALEGPAFEHAAFLDSACLRDAALRARFESLLASRDASTNPPALESRETPHQP